MQDSKTSVFFFAHQDDEFGVYNLIENEITKGSRVICLYLTDGAFASATSEIRSAESIEVLRRLKVKITDVHFVGEEIGISDGNLAVRLVQAGAWVNEFLGRINSPTSIYFPAWEGGHQDHDALHAMLVSIAESHGLLARCWQFSLYHSNKCPGLSFRVLSPLSENGRSIDIRIPWVKRFNYLRYCLSYPSQVKTWAALFPFVLFKYLLSGRQQIQPVSVSRISERPHQGKLFYEKRGNYTWADIIQHIDIFRLSMNSLHNCSQTQENSDT